MTDKRSLPGILPSFSSPNRWTMLIVAGIGLIVVTLGVSGVVAPPVEEATADPERQQLTLVGSHGGGPGWHEYGSVYLLDGTSVVWRESSAVYNAPEDPTTRDWLHINDVDVIEEGRYLVSVRNANQILIVQRGSGVVEVINEDRDDADDDNCNKPAQLVDYDDGDIRCGNPDVLDHQHNPQWLGDGAILVADSGNDRVVELHVDDGGNWTPAWTLSRAGGIEFNWPRDADRLPNGNTLITDTLNRRIVEVNASGDVVWSTQTEYLPYEADRLPAGEPVGGQQYVGGESSSVTSGGDVPVLSALLVGIRAIVPSTPFWFGEVQLGLTLVSTGLVVTGLVGRTWYR